MNLAIAISRRDKAVALLWAKWIAAIGVEPGTRIYLTFDQKVDDDTLSAVHHVLRDMPEVEEVDIEIYFGPDPGYPGGANRMFIFTARRAATAGQPFLWMETDMIPLRSGWMSKVREEYEQCGQPFMGPILHIYDTPHMNGTGVYPPNWEELSNIAEAPDHWPWDTFSRETVFPIAARSQTLKHTYGNKTFPRHKDDILGTEVFHPCKDGTLVEMLNHELKLLPAECFSVDPRFVRIEGCTPEVQRLNAIRVPLPGVSWYVARLDTIAQQIHAFRNPTFQEIDQHEYNHLIGK
jgi:hypothetical protein